MVINRPELKWNAKSLMKGKGGELALVTLLYLAVNIALALLALIPIIGYIASILLTPALELGMIMLMLRVAKSEETLISDLFGGFNYFLKAFGLTFMVGLFTFLWSLLFIIPGIIAAFRYSMAFYILADNPEIGVFEAIEESKRMTKGYKWQIFVLELSFIGWAILSVFTLYILLLWLVPYMLVTTSLFYLKLKEIQSPQMDHPSYNETVVEPSQDSVVVDETNQNNQE